MSKPKESKTSASYEEQSQKTAESYYSSKFSGLKSANAFKLALELRTFEIELYWKRTAYFWAFILVAFAGFITVMSVDSYGFDNELWMLAVSSFGVVVSSAWVLVNKGSKYWQENWENHIDQLEDSLIGPLYKTILERPEKGWTKLFNPLAPARFSVSTINQIVSVFVLVMWGTLFAYSTVEAEVFNQSVHMIFEYFLFALPLITVASMIIFGRSGSKPQTPILRPRKSEISDYIKQPNEKQD